MNKINKGVILFLTIGLLAIKVSAQVKVGDNPTVVNSSAVFEMESTSKGLLLPRMTSAQRNAIVSPATGLVIYNTTKNCVEHYNGSAWYNACDRTTTPSNGGEISSGGTAVVSAWSSNVGCRVGAGVNNSPAGVRRGAVNQTMVMGSAPTATVTLVATVSTAGTYNILTNTVNGIYFSASGTFGATGSQTITLTATGSPLAAGNFMWTTNSTPSISIHGSVLTVEAPLGSSYYAHYNGIIGSAHVGTTYNLATQTTGEVFSNNAFCQDKPVSAQGCGGVTSVTANSRTHSTVNINGQCWLLTNMIDAPSVYSAYTSSSWTGTTTGDQGYWGYYNTSMHNNNNNSAAWQSTEPGTNEGVLYQWCGAMDASISERSKGICPAGFHIPSDCEWMYLEHGMGMSIAEQIVVSEYRAENNINQGRPADKLLNIYDPLYHTNASGFTAIVSGMRGETASYIGRGESANFWSSTSQSVGNGYSRNLLQTTKQGVLRQVYGKGSAFSVRCLKD